ncbi:MAG: N-acetylneuraminate synthase [Candidatus Margulisiibacteriota bacterium]|nr:N-acetylneuraminate synthase [Candidatus Margulisiibacteriota bacterium]
MGKKVFIIAEAGVNHNGSLKLAKKMVDAAKSAGADAIKFQTFNSEELVTASAPKAAYQKKTVPRKSQLAMLKELELSREEFDDLSKYCRKKKIMFLSTPFDLQSADFLNGLKLPLFKISSGEITNIPLLTKIAKYKKPIILSTGMSTIDEVKRALQAIYAAGNRKLTLLHCTSNYPTKYDDVNLKAMLTLKTKFNVPVGYSDHTEGIEVSVAAVAMGAAVIEKHFTLDKKMAGPDHKASLSPVELAAMVRAIRNVEKSLGDGIKRPRIAEKGVSRVIRKSLIALSDIARGEKIVLRKIGVKRPGSGIEPRFMNKIIGKLANKNIKKDQVLTWDKVKR